MINSTIKSKILTAIKAKKQTFTGSDKKLATTLGISPSQFSRIMKGETEQVISDASWITIARILSVSLTAEAEWKTAETPVFLHITGQLETCQQQSISGIYCDAADVGKSHAARHYVKTHRNAVYIDCSQVKSKQKLVRSIAREFGVNHTAKYAEVYADLVTYLRVIQTPIIILDEAGDLHYEAFLEIKALWNATERCCGWYMMGADGLKKKIDNGIINRKVGFTEVFSRYGTRYQRATPEDAQGFAEMAKAQAALIIRANAPSADVQQVLRKTGASLRRVFIELAKTRQAA